jgi:hypothetical protein
MKIRMEDFLTKSQQRKKTDETMKFDDSKLDVSHIDKT